MLGDRQLWRHAGCVDGAPLLAGCREEYHDLQGLIRPGGLAIRSCDPISVFIQDQPSRLVGMRETSNERQGSDNICFAVSTATRPIFAGRIWTQFQSVIQYRRAGISLFGAAAVTNVSHR